MTQDSVSYYDLSLRNISRFVLYMALLFSVFFCTLIIGISKSYASTEVDVRHSIQKNYDRIVFDWPKSVKFSADTKNTARLILKFGQLANLNMSAINHNSLRFIKNIAVKKVNGKTVVSLSGVSKTKFNYFKIGNKVIVDISGPKLVASIDAASVKSASKLKISPPSNLPSNRAAHKNKVIAFNAKPAVLYEVSDDLSKTTGLITVSSTHSFGMAAFVRDRRLWLISDQANMVIPPQITGGAQDWLGEPRRMALENGTIFIYNWPFSKSSSIGVTPEGGGLLWRFIIKSGENYVPMADKGLIKSQKTHGSDQNPVTFVGVEEIKNILPFINTVTGKINHAVTVSSSDQHVYLDRSFVSFSIDPAFLGAVIVDNLGALTVEKARDKAGVIIAEIGGDEAKISKQTFKMYNSIANNIAHKIEVDNKRIYFMDRWRAGGIAQYKVNRIDLEERLTSLHMEDDLYPEIIMSLAKMHLANFMPQEAIGYFNLAGDRLDKFENTPEYIALRGAAGALSGHNMLAKKGFDNKALRNFPEIDYWRAYNYGRMELWDKAYQAMPKLLAYIDDYPDEMFYEIALMLAEIALRHKDIQKATDYLDAVQVDIGNVKDPFLSSYHYLQGELRRQQGDVEAALSLWKQLLEEGDKLFHAKASLAWAKLSLLEKEITNEKAIDVLEGVRFTWRGDGLETQISHELGLDYIKNENYKKALSLLRDTASITKDERSRALIVDDMQKTFVSLFLGEYSEGLSPIQSVTVYETFSELLPSGEQGDAIVQALIDKLVEVDLIDRSVKLLEQLIKTRLTGEEKNKAILRVARLYLIDQSYNKSLEKTDILQKTGITKENSLFHEMILIRAKSLSEIGHVEEALKAVSALGISREVDQLRADIAWSNGSWNVAANALISLIAKNGIVNKNELSDEEAKLVLNTAVSINLAGDLQRLQNFQRQFSDIMSETSFGRLFQIVTRPPGDAFLASRDTILEIVDEVDLFEGLLGQF